MSNKTVYYGEQDEKMVKEVFKYFKKQRNRNTVNYSNTFLDCMRVFHDLFVESEKQNYQLRLEQLKHMEKHIKSLEAQLHYAENSPTSKDELSQKVDQLLKNSNTQGRLINQQLNYLQKVSQFLQNQPQFNKKPNRNDYNRSY